MGYETLFNERPDEILKNGLTTVISSVPKSDKSGYMTFKSLAKGRF